MTLTPPIVHRNIAKTPKSTKLYIHKQKQPIQANESAVLAFTLCVVVEAAEAAPGAIADNDNVPINAAVVNTLNGVLKFICSTSFHFIGFLGLFFILN